MKAESGKQTKPILVGGEQRGGRAQWPVARDQWPVVTGGDGFGSERGCKSDPQQPQPTGRRINSDLVRAGR